ncbi:hypothetical protein BCR34DRAFT_589921 [Clohesyomyces aquaticus]|uniref:Uncharacterized protein n=1 Tax=Clohesyomyces aquaticus TaxID=1231657 RepID=A0A1Y1ZEY2_9PLEO|nr:hypothetical protein BCR34DRAFT_589921 [Clohesyomyces aquaticus]
MGLPHPLSIIEGPSRDVCDGKLCVRVADLKQIFESSLKRTYDLIADQVHEAKKSEKAALKVRIRFPWNYSQLPSQHFDRKKSHRWSAVVRSAPAKGLEDDDRTPIQHPKCRRHYGTNSNQFLKPGVHRKVDTFVFEYSGYKMDLSTTSATDSSLEANWKFWPGKNREGTIDFLASEKNEAPQTTSDLTVYKVARLEVDLKSITESLLIHKRCASGQVFHEVKCKIQVSLQNSLDFSLTIDGIPYGSVMRNTNRALWIGFVYVVAVFLSSVGTSHLLIFFGCPIRVANRCIQVFLHLKIVCKAHRNRGPAESTRERNSA